MNDNGTFIAKKENRAIIDFTMGIERGPTPQPQEKIDTLDQQEPLLSHDVREFLERIMAAKKDGDSGSRHPHDDKEREERIRRAREYRKKQAQKKRRVGLPPYRRR